MSTWFTVVVRVASVERITDSAYTNALCMFPEGERTTPTPEDECWRSFYIAFYGRVLEHDQNYIVFGNARLPGNNEADKPMFTATDAIPYLSQNLPVHYLRVHGNIELTTKPKLNRDGEQETYEFQGNISGYYNDPCPAHLRSNKSRNALANRTTPQHVYAKKEKHIEFVIGNAKTVPGTQLFFIGDYTFPDTETHESGYIDLFSATFNSTHRSPTTAAGGSPNTSRSGGASRRRHVPIQLYSSPSQSKAMQPPSTPSRSQSKAPNTAMLSPATDDIEALPGPSTPQRLSPWVPQQPRSWVPGDDPGPSTPSRSSSFQRTSISSSTVDDDTGYSSVLEDTISIDDGTSFVNETQACRPTEEEASDRPAKRIRRATEKFKERDDGN